MIEPRPKRAGPTWAEILLSFGCSMLIATDVLTGRASILPQTAEAYYTAYKEVQAFHFWSVFLDVTVLVTTLGWILFSSKAHWFKTALLVFAIVGVVLAWSELVWAAHLRSAPVFHLSELPFRPLGNSGIVGAQLFGTYILVRLPSGKVGGWQAIFIKGGLAVCLWALQMLLWDGISRSSGAGA